MIDIFVENNLDFSRENLKNVVKKTATLTIKELKPSCQEIPFYVSILLTNNERIKKINNKYRKIKKPTNVLAFPQNKEKFMQQLSSFLLLGDIVISIEKIKMESKEQKKIFNHHLSHMVVHGLLHLLGYKHENNEEAKLMEIIEREILSKLSIPDPFRSSYD